MTLSPDSPEYGWLALSLVGGLGFKTIRKLQERFGGVADVLSRPAQDLKDLGKVSQELALRISRATQARSFRMECRLLDENPEIRLLCPESQDFPTHLAQISTPPSVLYWQGNLEHLEAPCFAFVGSRRCTPYGRQQTKRLVVEIAEAMPNAVIVSGLARGIDTTAHEAALEHNLKTVAVLAGGLQHLYPPENQSLAEAIKAKGALISEFPLAVRPLARNFPIRNRVISGVSLGVVVTEAHKKSGANITAAFALQQNREVFALPGRVDSPASEGTNRLISRSQAKLVSSASDILEEFPNLPTDALKIQSPLPLSPSSQQVTVGDLPDSHHQILKTLEQKTSTADDLHAQTGIEIGIVLSALVELELMGFVRLHGQTYQLEDNISFEPRS